MAYAEKRGKGPKQWRVKYKLPDGSEGSESGFETKKAALVWGRDQESQIRHGHWADPRAGDITVDEWIKEWLTAQEVGISTADNRDYLIRRFIRPRWGVKPLNSLTQGKINEWERGLPAAEHVAPRTARDARSLLCTILGDAVAAKPPLIPFNPAIRPRNRGKKTGRKLASGTPRTWATPLESLLIAERAALLSGQDDDFTMITMIAYTGMRYLFTGPDGGHHRRSDYARRVFRPACDGRYPPEKGEPGKLVIVDGATWPGRPVASWAPASAATPFEPPSGRGNAMLINGNDTGRCPACGRSFKRCTDGGLITHKSRAGLCPGSGDPPAEDPVLAAWLPVKAGLTPHGLRHSHKTWMVEDGIPEILTELRLGHDVPGMRGLYSHVSDRMREELKDALQARWEESLRARAALAPSSAVSALDKLLAPLRDHAAGENLISQISPNGGSTAAAQVA